MPPRDPREQHEHNRVEAHTIIHARTPATRIRRTFREQRLDRLAKLVPHPPNRARHRAPPQRGYVTQQGSPSNTEAHPQEVLKQLLRTVLLDHLPILDEISYRAFFDVEHQFDRFVPVTSAFSIP
jgi:hypothetical protein